MRKMSLDVGTRTIGIAVSDLLGMIANGVETIHRTTEERDYARIAELIAEHEVDTLVVGYPKNMTALSVNVRRPVKQWPKSSAPCSLRCRLCCGMNA